MMGNLSGPCVYNKNVSCSKKCSDGSVSVYDCGECRHYDCRKPATINEIKEIMIDCVDFDDLECLDILKKYNLDDFIEVEKIYSSYLTTNDKNGVDYRIKINAFSNIGINKFEIIKMKECGWVIESDCFVFRVIKPI
jgi:hypothetical protein